MTIQDLIDVLNKFDDKSLSVLMEGCDCASYWNGESHVFLQSNGIGEIPKKSVLLCCNNGPLQNNGGTLDNLIVN